NDKTVAKGGGFNGLVSDSEFPRKRESTFESRQLFSNICFLGFLMDSRLRGNDGGGVFDVVCS
ncbi:hypothetical protein, partial [Neisseria sicca]|uniref:hypothetical protein n=1 Tax=Neisseria sicca TaxID=490 RepID=UPI003C73D694